MGRGKNKLLILKLSLRCPFSFILLPLRTYARDSEGFLEDDLAGELCKCCHGYQPGGSWQGMMIAQSIQSLSITYR